MNKTVTVDIPHRLGLAGARARIDGGIDKIASYIPGASVTSQRWDGDTMLFTISAMGQTIASRLDVQGDKVQAALDLPMMLAMFAEKAKEMLQQGGQKLLR